LKPPGPAASFLPVLRIPLIAIFGGVNWPWSKNPYDISAQDVPGAIFAAQG
jgi:hypothetical protein